MKIPLQSRKRGSINERLHLFAKDEKGYPFYQLALVATRRKRVPFFLSILLSLKTIGKGVKFQDITPMRATFTSTIASGINNSYSFSWLSSVDKVRISILFFVINNVAKSLKELVFDPPEWNCWMFHAGHFRSIFSHLCGLLLSADHPPKTFSRLWNVKIFQFFIRNPLDNLSSRTERKLS